MVIVIAYDIKSQQRRNRVFRVLNGYGVNSQRSVFECEVKDTQFAGLLSSLERIIHKDEDDLRIYKLCADCAKKVVTLGAGQFNRVSDIIVI